MAFGIYVHIPFCRQICSYCDFTKYELGKVMPPERYVELLLSEIRSRAKDVPVRHVDSIYFGGGTPSLLEPDSILAILRELANVGFGWTQDAELTIEIDPATLDERKLDSYLQMGLNRFSVGAQSFDDRFLKMSGRKHASRDVKGLLKILQDRKLNYSFDLLFALPTQTLADLRQDLEQAVSFEPSHLSAYCLTVPEGHRMSFNRAPDEEQGEMFELIESELAKQQIMRYEISNFARVGRESKHNLLYWHDQPYWGLGLSSHSYFPRGSSPELDAVAPWGLRFWNVRAMKEYEKQILAPPAHEWHFAHDLPEPQRERLALNEALSDFCHTSLRVGAGLNANALRLKFGDRVFAIVHDRIKSLLHSEHLEITPSGWRLSLKGQFVANLVFEKLTFLASDLLGRYGLGSGELTTSEVTS